jgi:hypothetical protein
MLPPLAVGSTTVQPADDVPYDTSFDGCLDADACHCSSAIGFNFVIRNVLTLRAFW